uniref:protein LSM14 homolog B-like isoform X2 n=1 Tax=Myxine glutinosa TaxID=7769 RepID=UPI00358F355D
MSGGMPYLGHVITLISKAEIRYEGLLYTIDADNATIVLAKVRMFGTEDRRGHRHVAPQNDLYEYVIFRATDIKEVTVQEGSSGSMFHSDPAIVHSAIGTPGGMVHYTLPGCAPNPNMRRAVPPTFPARSMQPSYSHVTSNLMGRQCASMNPNHLVRKVMIEQGVQTQVEAEHEVEEGSACGDRAIGGYPNRASDECEIIDVLEFEKPPGPPSSAFRSPSISELQVEYDFASANARFKKYLNTQKLGNTDQEACSNELRREDPVYDRSKSFFDNFSSDIRNKRITWEEERRLAAETFGVVLPPSRTRRQLNWPNLSWFGRRATWVPSSRSDAAAR